MPLFGAHMSIAGGLHKAIDGAAGLGMATVQIFTHSPSQWAVKSVTPTGKDVPHDGKSLTHQSTTWRSNPFPSEKASQFRAALKESGLRFSMAHDSYLINLASPNPELFRKSVDAFAAEVERAEQLGLSYLVMHPGCPTDGNDDAGLERITRALDEVHQRCPEAKVKVLLETTAGQGCTLGHRFEHLAWILDHVKEPERLGVCLDTCHVFAAGYPLFPKKEYRKTFRQFDETIGIRQLKAFHVNDSKKPLGSRVDRHAHIGQGCLGVEPFRLLVNDSRFRRHPMILETPKEGAEGEDMDAVNLEMLRGLVE